MPIAAGILSIIPGMAYFVGGIMGFIGSGDLKNAQAGALYLVMGSTSLVGGIFALKRRIWGLALAGVICTIVTPPFYSTMLGIPATIFVAMSKKEFGKVRITEKVQNSSDSIKKTRIPIWVGIAELLIAGFIAFLWAYFMVVIEKDGSLDSWLLSLFFGGPPLIIETIGGICAIKRRGFWWVFVAALLPSLVFIGIPLLVFALIAKREFQHEEKSALNSV
jgi:hypothetical protein